MAPRPCQSVNRRSLWHRCYFKATSCGCWRHGRDQKIEHKPRRGERRWKKQAQQSGKRDERPSAPTTDRQSQRSSIHNRVNDTHSWLEGVGIHTRCTTEWRKTKKARVTATAPHSRLVQQSYRTLRPPRLPKWSEKALVAAVCSPGPAGRQPTGWLGKPLSTASPHQAAPTQPL